MPVQRFPPRTKDFATFDCDAHVPEPPLIWQRANDFLSRDELDALNSASASSAILSSTGATFTGTTPTLRALPALSD
jgi:hypothetical protein